MERPYRNLFFRILNFIVRNLPIQHKFAHSGILMKKCFNEMEPIQIESKEYSFVLAGPVEIRQIVSHPETNRLNPYNRRLDSGHLCYCAKKGNNVAAFIWVNFKSGGFLFGRDDELIFFPINNRSAFHYDIYTYSDYRRCGIASQLKLFIFARLREMGIKYVYGYIDLSNLPSLRINLRTGSIPDKMIYCYRIHNWEKVFWGTDKEIRLFKKWLSRLKA